MAAKKSEWWFIWQVGSRQPRCSVVNEHPDTRSATMKAGTDRVLSIHIVPEEMHHAIQNDKAPLHRLASMFPAPSQD